LKCDIVFIAFFNEECKEDAQEECSEFLLEVPLDEMSDPRAFEHFCK